MKNYLIKIIIRGKREFLFSLSIFLLVLPAATQDLDMDKLKDLKTRSIGPAGMSGRVTAIDVVLSNPAVIYAGTASGGLWKSESGGVEWKPLFDGEKVASIGAVAIDQQNPDVVWAGTGEGNPRNSLNGGYGIYKSLDGGKNWKLMGLEETRHIHRIIIHPDNGDIVYVGAIGSPWGPHPERGVFKTTDGGKTWQHILFVNELTGVGDMIMDPSNPNKLFVNMWEHRRWPWFFKSGGPGSGLHVTFDGGVTWKKLTNKEGLPEGELGRMGLAIARSNPKVVYALIESKKNALYKSDDGGFTWQKVGENNIGDRPFYYADIYVDPMNENRIYTLFSRVNVSEDGGRTFRSFISRSIHPDHHAWWIHPENQNFMIEGNDGGMAITRDRGETWKFITNLPLGQFYHINVDLEQPYNIYGGLQDNGSWKGPAYIWSSGGIINTYWDQLYGGDGFDVVPDRSDSRYCYAMSQQGNVARIDLLAGRTKSIKPVHPEGKDLRFHWNSAIAHDPFDNRTIYFGSQFVHKSTDRGENWEIISPDLTTNDPEKQKYGESGGLTYDVTGAENHTTILAIAPSPVQKDMIWVGTDDGNLQLTLDGGKSWNNLNKGLKDIPAGSWIPQIHPSRYSAGEAYVVVNNYRRNDYSAYLYHTTNFGKTWERIVDDSKVWGYVLSFEQDPVEPKLMFLGTEFGLYTSIDRGQKWTKWTNGYPTVSTMDMVIHPREHDLVIGTFGRAVYILDDIRPLRELARDGLQLLEEEIHVFDPPEAIVANYKNSPGYYSAGDAYFTGENRPRGAMITYSVKEGEDEENIPSGRQGFGGFEGSGGSGGRSAVSNRSTTRVKIEISDETGKVIRTLTQVPKTGVNRVYWDLDKKGYRSPGSSAPRPGSQERGGGGIALPGNYMIRMTYNGHSDSAMIRVNADPRIDFSPETARKNQEIAEVLMIKMEKLAVGIDRLKECKETINAVNKQIPGNRNDAIKKLREVTRETEESLKALSDILLPKEDIQGIYRDPNLVTTKLRGVRSITNETDPLNTTQKWTIEQSEKLLEETLEKINTFFEVEWEKYKTAVSEAEISFFKEYDPLIP
ncbi:MAG: hypothetical protein JSV24_09360 [Bacteroidales bacterium]|nr:MAG: hypothetical protein JSV24_09360 [Bacteroidales bacterium]